MTRDHLAGSHEDAANAVLAAVGYNSPLLLKWLWLLCALSLICLANTNPSHITRQRI